MHGFMIWNLFLAAIPAWLAIVLFCCRVPRNAVWWLGLGAWLVFLPNAPYVLTDVTHMIDDVQAAPSKAGAYELLAIYAVFYTAGLAAYVLALQLFRRYMHLVGLRTRVVAPLMLAVHALVIVAMYVGRALRFNSWDVLFAPGALLHAVARVPRVHTIAELVAMFVVVGVGAFAMAACGDKVYAHVRRFLPR